MFVRLRPLVTAVVIALGHLGGSGCATEITRVEARRLVRRERAVLVDVRARFEYDDRHIPGAINIPIDDIERRAAELGPRDRPILVYCHTGIRAGIAARLLRRAGFTRVYNFGTIGHWTTDEREAPSMY